MAISNVILEFEPKSLTGSRKNEITMRLRVSAPSGGNHYWCECDITANAPLSLAHDKDLHTGRTRVGIISPVKSIEKQVKLYTNPAIRAMDYMVSVTTYLYDEDGAIADRHDTSTVIKCEPPISTQA
jgi:hypothetical protein